MRPGFRSQLDTLFDRNLAILSGSPGTLAVYLGQPPLIGYLIGVAFRDTEATDIAYFIMALSAVYLGCMNACGAIVRERAIYTRERMTGLRLWSYVFAKLQLLGLVGFVQCLLLFFVASRDVTFADGWLRDGAMLFSLTATNLAATALGLAISAFARTVTTAVVVVPLIILPQIIFSEVVLGSRSDTSLLAWLSRTTITKWSHDALTGLAAGEWLVILTTPLVLLGMGGTFVVICALKLRLDES